MTSIRFAEQTDIEAIVRLVNSAFLVELFFIERDRTDAVMIREMMGRGKFLLADDGSSLAGCVYVELRGDRGYIGMLSVDPARQRGGLGHQLMAAAENFFKESGCHFSDLRIVNVRTDLRDFYRKSGYSETGTSEYENRFPTKIPVHFIELSKALA